MAARYSRSGHRAADAVRPPTRCDVHPRTAHDRRRQAVHPLGQDRDRDAHGSVCPARLPERVRHRVSGRAWRPRPRPAWRPLARRGVGARVHAEPDPPDGQALDRPASGCAADRKLRAARFPKASRPASGGDTWRAASKCRASFFDGFNHLPVVEPVGPLAFRLTFPSMRMYGGDAVVPSRWVTIKGEGGYFTSDDPNADDYVLFVVELERQQGEVLVAGGYAGEHVTSQRAVRTVCARPRHDQGAHRARVVHDRSESERRRRKRRAHEPRRDVPQSRVLAGARRSLANDGRDGVLSVDRPTTFSASTAATPMSF